LQPRWNQPEWIEPQWIELQWIEPQWIEQQWIRPQWIRPQGTDGVQDPLFVPFPILDPAIDPAAASPEASVVAQTLFEAQAMIRSAETRPTPAEVLRGLSQMDALIAKIRSASWKLPAGRDPALPRAASIPLGLLG